jgi:hypothetical protein
MEGGRAHCRVGTVGTLGDIGALGGLVESAGSVCDTATGGVTSGYGGNPALDRLREKAWGKVAVITMTRVVPTEEAELARAEVTDPKTPRGSEALADALEAASEVADSTVELIALADCHDKRPSARRAVASICTDLQRHPGP